MLCWEGCSCYHTENPLLCISANRIVRSFNALNHSYPKPVHIYFCFILVDPAVLKWLQTAISNDTLEIKMFV